ncbi:MAG: 16S rRNA (adenine(1518)-N(6)/adenine(1519)-N(6))-dimethyltransferase RsmA [bacterium]|nr:16S rRNA (adenine(1518)-N(6)/adenine(1519)-N(6))-dimethyltransferase RsmA [bacterium]
MHFAKKSLGQNFLKSKEALRDLVEAGDILPTDIILEVGPGKGVLTRELIAKAKKVIAVEKDSRLIEILNEEFKDVIQAGKLEIIEQDILEFDPEVLKKEGESYKIIANIPYYITGTFLQKFLEHSFQPSRMVVMVQKEVVQRIVARDNKESILSLSVKAFGTPKYVSTVKAKYFSPEPKVDSAIILISNISRNFFTDISEEHFFTIMKAGFAHKRKMVIGNLKEKGIADAQILGSLFDSLSINKKARAEDLTLEQWKQICLALR